MPEREIERLNALDAFAVLDTLPEPCFDELAQLAAQICDTPIAAISMLDRDRQWFKARVGIGATEIPRAAAFCSHTIRQAEVLVVADATRDRRFAANPLVTGDPNIRFYAGAPLTVGDDLHVGTLCVIDRVPREVRPDHLAALRILSRQVVNQLELRRHVVHLRKTVEERKRAETALRDFVAMVTHDIRNPLDVIRGYSSMLRDEAQVPATLAALDQIDAGSNTILSLVTDYLESSRLAAGKLELDLVALPLAEFLGRVVASYQGGAQRQHIVLELVVDPRLPDVLADALSLERIAGNLLQNALKHAPAGGRILVGGERRGDHVVLSVTDNGPGVPADDLPNLFRSYWQSRGLRQKGGSGLGLYIVRLLAEALGGHATATNVPSGGCRVEIELRAAHASEQRPQRIKARGAGTSLSERRRRGGDRRPYRQSTVVA